MSKIKAPPDKKRLAYDRDSRTEMEAPHAFRKNWPKKKAGISRTRRRVADRTVRAVVKGADADQLLVPKRLRVEHLHKTGVGPLRTSVARQNERRRRTKSVLARVAVDALTHRAS
jgi:hypothetical protein